MSEARQPRTAGEDLYRRAYYERWYLQEHGPYRDGKLRREDMVTSILLACLPAEKIARLADWTDLAAEFDYAALEDPRRTRSLLDRPGLCPPRQVLDVGCGRGELVAAMNNLGVPVTGVDPSPAAVEYSRETLAAWCDRVGPATRVERAALDEIAPSWLQEPAGVVVFLESIEHAEREAVRRFFREVLGGEGAGLVAPGCRVIIANIWFPVWDPPDHLWGVGRSPASGEENRRLGRPYWWMEYDRLRELGRLVELFRSPTNPTVVFERA